tara:strand:+ start:97 stop:513 length:417 start_codon:yes stop_codon:yes gene_type:complete
MKHLKIQYPSLKTVRSHILPNGNSGIVTISMLGVKSHTDDTTVKYDLIIDFRRFPVSPPSAYVRHPSDPDIRHVNIGERTRVSFAPRAEICWVCVGGKFPEQFESYARDRKFRLATYIQQLQYTLRNPNPMDCARHTS